MEGQYAGWFRAQLRVVLVGSETHAPGSGEGTTTCSRATTVEEAAGALRERVRAGGLEVELCGATGACSSVHARVSHAADVLLVDLVRLASTASSQAALTLVMSRGVEGRGSGRRRRRFACALTAWCGGSAATPGATRTHHHGGDGARRVGGRAAGPATRAGAARRQAGMRGAGRAGGGGGRAR